MLMFKAGNVCTSHACVPGGSTSEAEKMEKGKQGFSPRTTLWLGQRS